MLKDKLAKEANGCLNTEITHLNPGLPAKRTPTDTIKNTKRRHGPQ